MRINVKLQMLAIISEDIRQVHPPERRVQRTGHRQFSDTIISQGNDIVTKR